MSGKSGCNSSEQECKKGPERCCCSGAGNLFSRLLCLLLHLLLRFRILHFFDLVPKGLSEFLNHLLWIVDLLAGGSQRITGESSRAPDDAAYSSRQQHKCDHCHETPNHKSFKKSVEFALETGHSPGDPAADKERDNEGCKTPNCGAHAEALKAFLTRGRIDRPHSD